MGIRTQGYTKVSQKSGQVGDDKVPPIVPKQEIFENTVDPNCGSKVEGDIKLSLKTEPTTRPVTRVTSGSAVRSPLKLRTPVSMARLGGMKVAARKLKKHRKRNLFVQSANKILRSSIKSNKTRRAATRLEEKPRSNGATFPSRVSTRTCVRRSSRDGIPDAPLRTVELIQLPLEDKRQAGTKLLYMASLGLYPKTGESDMTPIVVIKEVSCSPGKKNGVRKSLELPLIPYHKRFLDLASHDKESISENIMPGGKQLKRDSRKISQNTSKDCKIDGNDAKKPVTGRKTPNNVSPPKVTEVLKTTQGPSSSESAKSNTQQQQQVKKKTPPPKGNSCVSVGPASIAKQATTLDLTVTAIAGKMANSLAQESGKMSPNSNSKSLLKSNISPSSKYAKDIVPLPLPLPLNLTASLPARIEAPKPITTESLLASQCSVTQAMNLIMSNITIHPSCNTTASRKRCANDNAELKIEDITNSKNFTIHNTSVLAERKPPKKKQKRNSGEKNLRNVLPTVVPMPISVSSTNSTSGGSLFLQPLLSQNTDEALNLCMKKRNSEPLANAVMQLPPKLQLNSNVNVQKVNGSKPLNLIIPRPPPLTKAPLEATNFANCTQNVQPVIAAKQKPKKTRKSRSNNNNNQLNQSNLQIPETLPMPVLPTLPMPLLSNADTTVHAKSLLKCMNGEENTCARDIGESLDSVKTMLSRLQTRIGPAVNGVRLITIE